MTTPPAAPTSEKTKLFIREPRGTRVILNYINRRGSDLFSWAAYYWVSFSWSAAWHSSTPQNFCHPQRLLRAVGRGWKGQVWRLLAPSPCWWTLLGCQSPGQCPGRHRQGISWQETPGQHSWHLHCPVWPSVSCMVLPAYTPHPSCMQMGQNSGKTAGIACPSVLP